MPKADLIRRIDHKPARSESGLGVYPSNTYGDGTGHKGPYCVGRIEGPRICITDKIGRGPQARDGVEFYVKDTANVPFVSFGEYDWPTNTQWINIGYADAPPGRGPNIRMPEQVDYYPFEVHRMLEIDAETLVGMIPCDVLIPSLEDCEGEFTFEAEPCSDASGTVETVDAYLVILNGCITQIVWKEGVKPSTQQSSMVLGILMGARYASSVYTSASAYLAK